MRIPQEKLAVIVDDQVLRGTQLRMNRLPRSCRHWLSLICEGGGGRGQPLGRIPDAALWGCAAPSVAVGRTTDAGPKEGKDHLYLVGFPLWRCNTLREGPGSLSVVADASCCWGASWNLSEIAISSAARPTTHSGLGRRTPWRVVNPRRLASRWGNYG